MVNEWDDSTSPNMPPIYDLILDQDGELLIQMVEAIDASDAWRQGKSQFPYTIRGVVFNGKQLKNGSFVTKYLNMFVRLMINKNSLYNSLKVHCNH